MAVYDATNPDARKFYWDLVKKACSASEPMPGGWTRPNRKQKGRKTTSCSITNWRQAAATDTSMPIPYSTRRPCIKGSEAAQTRSACFILSRSAFAGSQRNGVTAWSGDINSDWFSFRRQIPAGLNFAVSGIPYWTTDIGGFVFGSPTDPAFRELFIRWFQYGTFNPVLRVHGTRNPDENELWSTGPMRRRYW